MRRKIVCLLLIVLLILPQTLTVINTYAADKETQSSENGFVKDDSCSGDELRYYNPSYGDSYEAVKELSEAINTGKQYESDNDSIVYEYDTYERMEYFSSIEDAANYARSQMVGRAPQIDVAFPTSGNISSDEWFNRLMDEILKETSSPVEGDYLYLHCFMITATTYESLKSTRFVIEPTYLTNAYQESLTTNEVNRLLSSGELSGLYYANEYTKAAKVFDYITNTVSYDYSLRRFSAYDALLGKQVVCQGIASSYYRLCKELGLSVRVITSVDHAWNIVRIGNYYYNVDATFALSGGTREDNFLKGSGDNYFATKHVSSSEYNTNAFRSTYPISYDDYNGSTDYVTNQLPSDIDVAYVTHVQRNGWQNWVMNGQMSGTSGESKRLEGICINLNNLNGLDLGVRYRTHVQTYGWQNWVMNGQMSGTSGESKRLEAICIELTGSQAANYDIYYRVHAQTYGWLGWAKNGEPAGTSGLSRRLEAIQIVVLNKGTTPDGLVGYSYVEYGKTANNTFTAGLINYSTHVQTYGWQSYVNDGSVSGTFNESKRLESIRINLANTGTEGGIRYKTHVQTYGWQDWVYDGEMSGTSGESKRLEAIQIELTGQMAQQYDVYYRVHAQTYGWLDWAVNGQVAGTSGLSKRLEAIQIVVVPKGSQAPGPTARPYVY